MGIRSWTDKQLIEIVPQCKSYRQCVIKLGLKDSNNRARDLQFHIKRLNIDTSHFKSQRGLNRKKIKTGDKLKEGGSSGDIPSIRLYLVSEKLLPYECSICHLKDWQGNSITLDLDHINGIPSDHRLENLRFLCPNCHSQTDTYKGRNVGTAAETMSCLQCKKDIKYSRNPTCDDCRILNQTTNRNKAGLELDNKSDEWIISECVRLGSISAFEPIAKVSETTLKRYLLKRNIFTIIKEKLYGSK